MSNDVNIGFVITGTTWLCTPLSSSCWTTTRTIERVMDVVEESNTTGRTVDIELGSQEVITVDLDHLDPDPKDILDLLNEGHPKASVWTKLASEYWRSGYLSAAEQIGRAAVAGTRSTVISLKMC